MQSIPTHNKLMDLSNVSEQSQQSENYWSWKNILKQQIEGNRKQKQNPILFKNKPYIPKKEQERHIEFSQSNDSQKSNIISSQDDDKNPQIIKKKLTLQLKWSKTKSYSNLHHHEGQTSQNSLFKGNNTFSTTWQQTLQKLLSPIKVRIKQNWKDCQGWIKQGKIIFMSQHYRIQNVSKVKILPDIINNNNQFCAFKFVYFDDVIIIGMPLNRFFQQYPLHFAWFIAVIISKLKQKGYVRKGQLLSSNYTKGNKTPIKFQGKIFKKSQYLGKWGERRIQINNEGIYSYHVDQNPQKETFFISKDSIKYIWTRFDIYQSEYLVIKIKHGMRKTEIGIPINDLFQRKLNLIYSIYQLMMKF